VMETPTMEVSMPRPRPPGLHREVTRHGLSPIAAFRRAPEPERNSRRPSPPRAEGGDVRAPLTAE
jgi:hypothetical protein